VEAIDQFQVETSGTAVMYNGQGASNYVVKSGTNQFRSSVFEYFRHKALDAKAFFATTKPDDNQHEFGFTSGGPIRRNRMFFFVAYDGYKDRRQTPTRLVSIPTMAERAGDFSALPVPIFDPRTTRPNPNGTWAVGVNDQPHIVNAMIVYNLPFGTDDRWGSHNRVVSAIVRGWRVSGITQFRSGRPIGTTGSIGAACNLPNAGTCYASFNPSFSGPVRINGNYGDGDVLGANPHAIAGQRSACVVDAGPSLSKRRHAPIDGVSARADAELFSRRRHTVDETHTEMSRSHNRSSLEWSRPSDLWSHAVEMTDNRSAGGDWALSERVEDERVRLRARRGRRSG
jgi:hypothetical protein